MKQKSHRKHLTAKQLAFVKQYLATKNGTQAALTTYNTTDAKTAQAIATENLSKPLIREELARELEANGLSLDFVMRNHRYNIDQTEHLPTKQHAIDTAYRLYHLIGTDDTQKPAVNVAFVINNSSTKPRDAHSPLCVPQASLKKEREAHNKE